MQFGAQLLKYFTTWEELLSAIKVIDVGPWSCIIFSGIKSEPELFEQTQEEIISIFS